MTKEEHIFVTDFFLAVHNDLLDPNFASFIDKTWFHLVDILMLRTVGIAAIFTQDRLLK
jgi:hypothetical protein